VTARRYAPANHLRVRHKFQEEQQRPSSEARDQQNIPLHGNSRPKAPFRLPAEAAG